MPSHYDVSPITGLPQKRARKAVSDYLDWLSRGGGLGETYRRERAAYEADPKGYRDWPSLEELRQTKMTPQQRRESIGRFLDLVNPMAKAAGALGMTKKVTDLMDYRRKGMSDVANRAKQLMEQTGQYVPYDTPAERIAAFQGWRQFMAPGEYQQIAANIQKDWDRYSMGSGVEDAIKQAYAGGRRIDEPLPLEGTAEIDDIFWESLFYGAKEGPSINTLDDARRYVDEHIDYLSQNALEEGLDPALYTRFRDQVTGSDEAMTQIKNIHDATIEQDWNRMGQAENLFMKFVADSGIMKPK